jgi:hypothetical protein
MPQAVQSLHDECWSGVNKAAHTNSTQKETYSSAHNFSALLSATTWQCACRLQEVQTNCVVAGQLMPQLTWQARPEGARGQHAAHIARASLHMRQRCCEAAAGQEAGQEGDEGGRQQVRAQASLCSG